MGELKFKWKVKVPNQSVVLKFFVKISDLDRGTTFSSWFIKKVTHIFGTCSNVILKFINRADLSRLSSEGRRRCRILKRCQALFLSSARCPSLYPWMSLLVRRLEVEMNRLVREFELGLSLAWRRFFISIFREHSHASFCHAGSLPSPVSLRLQNAMNDDRRQVKSILKWDFTSPGSSVLFFFFLYAYN